MDDVRTGDPSLPQWQGPQSSPAPSPAPPPVVPASPPPATSVQPSVVRTVADGMEPDVVEPLSKAMRALDPDGALPANALGEIGAAALAQYYTPNYNRECAELQQGWRTAGDIAAAVRSCANVYASTEAAISDYTHLTLDQAARTDAEQANAQIWGDDNATPPPPNGAPLPAQGLPPEFAAALNNAAIAGPRLQTQLTNAGTRLLTIANALDISADFPGGRLPEVGQSQWSQAIFDAPALFTALTAHAYVQASATEISEGALPGIQSALDGAWSGQAWEAAYPVIENFTTAVRAVGNRAKQFGEILADTVCSYENAIATLERFFQITVDPAMARLQEGANDLRQIRGNPADWTGGAQEFRQEVVTGVPYVAKELLSAVTCTVRILQQRIQDQLGQIGKFDNSVWYPFPIITSGNNLPDAQTTPKPIWRFHPY